MKDLAAEQPQQPLFTGKILDRCADERPREKALANGIRSLSDSELLALLLGSGQPGKSAVDMAREILDSCGGSLVILSQLSIQEMTKRFKGVGPAKAVVISAALQLSSRLKNQNDSFRQVKSSRDAYDYVRSYLESLPTEEFWILILSRSNRIRRAECISRGGTAATYVEPKLVVKKALDHLAAGIILVHNHPSDNCRPSAEDERLTRRIKEAAQLLDIRVLDHLIITSTDYYSFADNGKL